MNTRSSPRISAISAFVRMGAPALAGLAMAIPVQAAEPPMRPNIIHIMVDDMSADAMGFRGRFPFLKTPHLDALAASGTVCNNFFVTTALCSPSRASILTGRYAHATGVPDNTCQLDPDASLPTYPQLLQEAGYVTAHIGKWHQGKGAQPRAGFSHWFAFDGHGAYFNPVMNSDGDEHRVDGYITDLLTDDAIRFIEQNRDRPFALNLWHKAAHSSFDAAPRHPSEFPHDAFPKHPTWDNDLQDKPWWMRRSRAYGVHLQPWLASEGKPIPDATPAAPFVPENTRKLRRHLATLLAVDDSVGRIMAALDKLGIADRTLVVFTADNGFFLGEYARDDKRLPDEPSIRVPMIVRYPPLDGPGRRIDAMGLNIDFAPTFLELAGVPVPESMQGESLLPILRGEKDRVRDHFLYEYFQEEYAPGLPTSLTIRNERWKYTEYPYVKGGYTELYDLQTDPMEEHSLAARPECQETIAGLRQVLQAELKRLGYVRPPYTYDPTDYPKPAKRD